MALTLSGTSGIVGAGIGTIGPSGANVTGVGTFTSVVSSGAVSGTTGTFSGDVSIADKIIHTGDTNTALRFPTADTITAETGGTERLRIDGPGMTGVRTQSPRATLHVKAHDNNWEAGLLLEDNTGNDGWNFHPESSDASLIIGYNDDTTLALASQTAELHTKFKSNGDLSIQSGDVRIEATSKGVTFPNSSLNEASSNMHLNVAAGNNDFYVQSGGTTFAAFKGSAKDLQLTSGNLVIGTAGKGIDFSAQTPTSSSGATNQAEILDHYEEGTWTPTISNGLSSISQVFDASARYCRIGKSVMCQFIYQFSGQGNGNRIELTGLPFTSVDVTSLGGGNVIWCNVDGLVDWNAIQLIVKKNSQTIECWKALDDNATTGSSISNKAIYGVITYEAP